MEESVRFPTILYQYSSDGNPPQVQRLPANSWVVSEAWRYTGPFSRFNRFKGAFPGLGIATVAFGAYLAYEATFLQEEHGHGHGESGH